MAQKMAYEIHALFSSTGIQLCRVSYAYGITYIVCKKKKERGENQKFQH